jgi:hypothetical protein
MDTTIDGFSLHQLDNGAYICTFSTGTPIRAVPKQVAFGEDCKTVVGGSDHGAVYVFDRRSGECLDILHHADAGLVQTITVWRYFHDYIPESDDKSRRMRNTVKIQSSLHCQVPAAIYRYAFGFGSTPKRSMQVLATKLGVFPHGCKFWCNLPLW